MQVAQTLKVTREQMSALLDCNDWVEYLGTLITILEQSTIKCCCFFLTFNYITTSPFVIRELLLHQVKSKITTRCDETLRNSSWEEELT